MTCEHKLGFANVREIQDARKSGVVMVCISGCGQRRDVWEDGAVGVIEKHEETS